jgi:transposase
MDRINPRCAGIDVHRDSLVACCRVDGRELPVETFGTTGREVLRLGDRLAELGVTTAAMESTGVYWRPAWNLPEDRFALVLVNAQHVKRVPGRKTDVSDAQWLARLHEHGLLTASFVPPRAQRELRDLTRQRTQLLGDRARVVNRVHKVLEAADVKIPSLITDLAGASGRRVLAALADGKLTAAEMADLVDNRMAAKRPALREALAGPVSPHARFMLRQLLDQIDHLDRQVEAFDLRVEEVMSPLGRRAVERLDDVPGFDVRTGQNVVAEVGTDMTRFPSAAHLASWAGLCPGNDESAGKRKGGRTRRANRWLKAALTQAAWGAGRTRASYFAARHRRLTRRRGPKRATVAVAHGLLGVAYQLLKHPDLAYTDLGADYFDRPPADADREVDRMLRKLKQLGCEVEIKRPAA